jgi:hypothetical protein
MKKKITNDPTKPIKRVYNDVMQRAVRYVDPTDIPEFHSLRSSLSRTRRTLLPDIPDDVDDVILEREWRRVSDLGLSTPYGRNRRLKKCIRKFMALAHLPVPLVRLNFGLLSTARSTRRLINRYPALFDFIRYLENNYIFGQYTVQRWKVYDRDIDTRTNNHVEDLYFLSRKISN